jgi:hypothetical protein
MTAPVGTNGPGCGAPVVADSVEREDGGAGMRSRTREQHRRAAIRDFVIAIVVLGVMLAMWWLVASTNREGEHDAHLLPFFALIPFVIGIYHLVRARAHA